MKIRVLCLLAIAAVLVSCSGNVTSPVSKVVSGTTFVASWDSHAEEFNFNQSVYASPVTTLRDMHLGNDFNSDIYQMDMVISNDLGHPSGLRDANPYDLFDGFYDGIGDID